MSDATPATDEDVAYFKNYRGGQYPEIDQKIAARIAADAEKIKRLREAATAAVAWMEGAEVQIDGEWGNCRKLAQLERDNVLSDELLALRAVLSDRNE